MVLTHVIESVTGQSYQSYLESTVLPAPDEVGVAQADPTQRHPREVSYHSPRQYPTALGSLPGTLALAYHYDDDTEIVAMFNRRPANPRKWSGILRSLDAAAAAVEEWPN